MDYQKLSKEIETALAQELHFLEHQGRLDLTTCTAKEILDVANGGIKRLETDPQFKAQVLSLASRMFSVVRENHEASRPRPIQSPARPFIPGTDLSNRYSVTIHLLQDKLGGVERKTIEIVEADKRLAGLEAMRQYPGAIVIACDDVASAWLAGGS